MSHPQSYRLGDLQLRIMKRLWASGASTVGEVQEGLEGAPLAYTTVATMLRKMEDRGLVHHSQQERRFLYEAAVTAEEVTRSMASDLVDRLFEGNLADAVSHLLQTHEVSPSELVRLEQLIRERKKTS